MYELCKLSFESYCTHTEMCVLKTTSVLQHPTTYVITRLDLLRCIYYIILYSHYTVVLGNCCRTYKNRVLLNENPNIAVGTESHPTL